MAIRKKCTYPGCTALVPCSGVARCAKHPYPVKWKGADERRPDAFYGTRAWKDAREEKLRSVCGLCERCGGIATEVHHKKRIRDGGHRTDQKNLEALCKPCHSSDTAKENRK